MELKVSFVKIIFFLVIVAALVSGCVIGDGERDYAMSHITSTDTQSSLIITTTIPIPSTPTPHSLYWIKIDPVSDKQQGDIFTVNASTNLSVGEEILIQVYTAHFYHAMKDSPSREFCGVVDTVKVIPGSNETNAISFVVNPACDLYPEEYAITEDAVYKDSTGNVQSHATGEALFNITPRKTS
jgi:hypothetical protein